MRFLLIVLCFICAPVFALSLPSSISGVYAGNDRVCSLVLSRSAALTKDAELHCLVWAPADQIYNVIRMGQPDGYCPSETQSFQFRSVFATSLTLSTPAFRIIDIDGTTLTVRIGTPAELAANGGVTQTWIRLAPLQSPAPYSCSNGRKRP